MEEELKNLLTKKQPRYITPKFMGEILYNKLLNRTNYLPDNISLSERIYHVIHGIHTSPKCPHCNNNVYGLHKFNIPKKEYIHRFCSKKCNRSYEYNMITPCNTIDYDKNLLIEQVNNGNIDSLRRNIKIMDQVKSFINDIIGNDYKQLTSSEALYFIKNNLKELPKCPITNDYLKYIGKGKYRKHSSSQSSAINPDTILKRTNTVKQKYGVDNVSKSEIIKNKISSTMKSKYNGKLYTQTEEYRERIKTGDIVNKMSEEGKQKVIRSQYIRAWERILSFSDIVKPLFTFDEYDGCGFDKQYKWLCVKTGKEFYGWYHQALIPKSPYTYNGSDIECFIRDYLKQNNISFQQNTKSLINPYELDFYIPDYKLAIECNGLYWHSEACGKDKKYHLNKTNLCKEKNIRLLHIFSDEMINKPKIIISKLNSIFNINKYRIYARKCEVKEISSKIKSKFLSKYHLQGNDNSSICLGLFYNNKLVSVMTFGSKRIAMGHTVKQNEYELIRFCNNYRFTVIGGASKLFKYFERNYNPTHIITYADKRFSYGNVYNYLGFSHKHDSKPNYWYTKNFIEKFHRFNFRKTQLAKKFDNFDSNKTEYQNMLLNGWSRVWDCGNMVFEKSYK